MNCKSIFLFSLFILIIPIAFTETSGNISLENLTVPPVTGLLGYTVQYCNTTADCGGYYCFVDYDGTSVGTWQGWCNSTSVTSCVYYGTWKSNGYSVCYDNSTRKYCSSGNWISEACGHGCLNGTCQSAPAGTTTSYDNDTTTQTASITIPSYPADFNITQNESIVKPLKVKNNGDFVLYNITLELSGIDFYSITPTKIDSMSINAEKTFSITFTIPVNATVKEYAVTATVKTSNSSASASASFKVKVLPSEETVKTDIIPLYQECLSILEELENNVTELEEKGINTTDIRALFNIIKDKLNQTNSSLEKKDYYTANQLLNDVNTKIEELKNMIATAEPEVFDFIIVIVVAVIIIIAAIIAYLFWPIKQGYRLKGRSSDVEDLLKKIKRKKGYGSKK